ncbi:hypothetical protein [Spiroplasma poulsonii]|nr:hypothetical protein [Spiroplasma poulsonii]UNF62431.1 hypothetical protein MNU24_02900 [Spiroplasma poulsonii]
MILCYIFGANATSLGFTTLLTDKIQGNVLEKDGKPTELITIQLIICVH